MRIKWENIFGLLFTVLLIILLFRLPDILDRLPDIILPPYYSHDPFYGIAIVGLICVTIVGVVKILSGK